MSLAKKYSENAHCSEEVISEYKNLAQLSIEVQAKIENEDKLSFADFLDEYFETIKIKGL